MQRIMVHPDLLDEKARMVQQKKQELERMVWELEKSIYMLQSEWSGITGEKFFQDFRLAREVFPTTLGLLSSIQNEFTFIANNFRTTDNTGEVALYIPEELKRDFTVGLLDGSVGETVTGIGDAANALWHDPFGTLASLGYGLTVGRVVDVGRGISFAWDALWGTGTARSDAEKFVEEQKKLITEDKTGYYGGALTGQALAYVFFGRALRSVDNKHGEIGGSSGGKSESGKGQDSPTKADSSTIQDAKKIIKFDHPADPFRDALGSGAQTHPEEWSKLINDLKHNNVEIVYREGGLGYGPLKKGVPGQILLDPNASMSALRHEYSHFLEAKANGFPSAAQSYKDWEGRIEDELKAYRIEIEEAKRLGLENVAKQLQKNFEDEKQYIIDRYKPIED